MDIVISYAKDSRQLAHKIKELLLNIYPDIIFPTFSYQGILNDQMRRKLRKYNTSTVCLLIVSDDLAQQSSCLDAWMYFWAHEVPAYIVTTQEDIVHYPLHVRTNALITLGDIKEVEVLLRSINKVIGAQISISEHAANVCADVYRYIKRRNHNLFETTILIDDDQIKYAKALAFYHRGDSANFLRIATDIRNDDIKYILIRQLKIQDVALMCDIANTFIVTEKIRYLIIDLINPNHSIESVYLYQLIDLLRQRGQVDLRTIAVHLIKIHQDDNPIFHHILNSIDNMAEFRKVVNTYIYIRKTEKPIFRTTIRRFINTNRAELRKVAVEMIEYNLQQTKEFQFVLEILQAENLMEYGKVIRLLEETDLDTYRLYPLYPRQYLS